MRGMFIARAWGQAGRDRAFLLNGLVHYDNSTEGPPDETTLGLSLVATPPRREMKHLLHSVWAAIFQRHLQRHQGIQGVPRKGGGVFGNLGELVFTEDLNCTSSAGSGG
ncbi:hypothetical protein I7I48_01559 [Histoplasma ohiense]|nr:hypothetical protein I7I48_01559 [Histoplasma ohiense (nom. inval.)]